MAIIAIFTLISAYSLQAELDSEVNFAAKSGTFRRLEEYRQRVKLEHSPVILSDKPDMTHSYVSPSGKFKIHYDKAGRHAVELTDKDQNGVPDYVDSVAYYFDFVFDAMVNRLGYHSPCPESDTAYYDVYLIEIGNGLKGDVYYGATSVDAEVYPRKIFPRYYSYIVLDNDYSPNDMTIDDDKTYRTFTTTGIDGMKVSVAHEFSHAVQFMYGTPYSNMFSINEMMSVYMENKMFPQSKDFLQYIRAMFKEFYKYPFGKGTADIGYSWGIYFHFVDLFFGEQTVKRMWELVESGLIEYPALDSALKEQGSSIRGSWGELLSWLYHTGSRTIDGYSFEQARNFPEFTFAHVGEINPQGNFNIAGQILPFEIRPIRYIVSTGEKFDTPDTLDFLFSNTDISLVNSQYMSLVDYNLSYPNQSEGSKPICDASYLLTINSVYTDTAFCRKGHTTVASESPYPSPFDYSKDRLIYIPTPKTVPYGTKVFVQIFNSEMVEVWSGEQKVMVHNSRRVAPIELNKRDIGSGIFIYRVTYSEKSEIGKFVVKR